MDYMNDLGSSELRHLDTINHSRLLDDKNNSMAQAQASRCYKPLRALVDINDWAQGSRFHE